MRLAIAENMHRSVTDAPHVTAVFEADFSAIMAHREAHKAAFAKKGVKLTYTAYLVAAAAEAMKVAPAINSRWHADRLELYDDINIGVGTALGEKGLIVPVVRKVQQLNLEGHRRPARRADREGAQGEADQPPTSAAAPSPSPTTASRARSSPRRSSSTSRNRRSSASASWRSASSSARSAAQDAIQIRPMAYVSLTIDHRVVDGHQTNAWLSRFVEVLESWPVD